MRFLANAPGGGPLARDYLAGVEAASAFYPGSPFAAATYRAKARELDAGDARAKLETARAIVRPAGPAAAAALERVARGDGRFVTTGQQPGLLGGPLYSLYKALSAARLAEELSHALDRPVLALFWVASDDHDLEEANRARVIDGANRLRALALPEPEGGAGRPLGATRLGPGVDRLFAELRECFPANDFRDGWLEAARASHRPEATYAEAFADLMATLLADAPVGLVDARHPALKRASRAAFRREVEDAAAAEAALTERSRELAARGYGVQAPVVPGALNLFVETSRGRARLRADGAKLRLGRSGPATTRARVLDAIEREPERFSPNVLLRPVVEACIFPTLAYVGGPAEVAYFAQLSGAFRRHGASMPVVAPRASLTAVERKVAKVMDKYGLDVGELRREEVALGRLARADVPSDVSRGLSLWRAESTARARELERATAALDPGLARAVVKARNAGLAALGGLERKIVRAAKRRRETARSQIAKARVHLWPADEPQERVLGPLQYLTRYGPDFVASAFEAVRGLSWTGGEATAASVRTDAAPPRED